MTATKRHLALCALLVSALASLAPAQAAKPKYTYLKIGEGSGAAVYAFKSKQACEAARRQHGANWARVIKLMKRQTGNRGTFAGAPRAKCLDFLPHGFRRQG
jgi:hypothetical protein